MPLLTLFSKRNRSSSRVSTVAYSNSNVSLNDDDYVSVASPSVVSHNVKPTGSPNKLALPFRRRVETTVSEDHSHSKYLDPLLEPPPRRSSLFQSYQDDQKSLRPSQSLPDGPEHSIRTQQQSTSQPTKRFIFNWTSQRERGKPVPPAAKPGPSQSDASFNLRSFRHVRPNSPSLGTSPTRSPSPAPALPPIPTSTFPSPPVSFQVTSRRPRTNSFSDLTNSESSPLTTQQKMAVGAFRQAARRSATSLSLADSPKLAPIRTSLDDKPPTSLLPPPQVLIDSQPRPRFPSPAPTYTPQPTTSSPPSNAPPPPKLEIPPSPKPVSLSKTPRTRTNAFADSSSSSSSEEEEEDSDSASDAADGKPRVSRRRTITQNQTRSPSLPPLSSSVRQQIIRATPPVSSSPVIKESFTTNDVPRPSSSLSVYGSGTRPRASLSVGALTPSAKETRASMASAANARLTNTTPRPLKRTPGSDTSESAESGSDSEEDAPLSSLIPPRRPGTSLSSHSTPSTVLKPLVDLNAPSSLTGRPVKAPPPFGRDEEDRRKPKDSALPARSQQLLTPVSPGTRPQQLLSSVSSSTRSQQLLSPVSSSTRSQQLLSPVSPGTRSQPLLSPASQSTRDSWVSQSTTSNPRISQAPSSRTVTSYDTPYSDNSSLISPISSKSGNGNRVNFTSSNTPNSVAPPLRPFARRDSPASSTGDSSSGRAPLTPRDGSDTRSTYSRPSAMSANRGGAGARRRKPSVTFEDDKDKERVGATTDEIRRKERRRSEARAAIELGNVVNGPPPVDDDDLIPNQHLGMHGGWPQPGMQMPVQVQMPAASPMFNMGMGIPNAGGYGMNYPAPMPNHDPGFLAAHQQAMAIAKQTFQYAVAQQALAAANDEWERNSTMTGYGGPSPAPQWGYGMGMRGSVMIPQAPRSMYAGSIGDGGGGGGGGGGGWGGTGSVYGNAFGSVAAAAGGGRNSTLYAQPDLSSGVTTAQRPVRPRTKTAPSSASPPAGTPVTRMPVPPSSFRGLGR